MQKEKLRTNSTLSTECSMHQLAPYIGKLKSNLVNELILSYSKPGDTILDPFAGAGTVALESLILGRHAIANDINPYAVTLIKAKMFPPPSLNNAVEKANNYIHYAKIKSDKFSLSDTPDWVEQFFHPKTLKEILALSDVLKKNEEHFLLACLLGILHHQRAGFLSYPSSHMVPYLRTKKFPRDEFSELYMYREVGPRLINKIKRAYKRYSNFNQELQKSCSQIDAINLNLQNNCIDALITSPPYMDALDYGRDNRLRLWFLGIEDYKCYDNKNPATIKDFRNLMIRTMNNLKFTMKDESYCIFILGDVRTSNNSINTNLLLKDIILNKVKDFNLVAMVEDEIPENRRSRRNGNKTKKEWISVFRKER
jgi:DNA modification methylase